MPTIDVITIAAPARYDATHLAWTAAMIAWALAVPLYVATKFFGVIAHEGGHALTGALLFQRVSSIRLTKGGGGATRFESAIPWLFDIVVTLAGYLGPSAFGLLGAWAFRAGHVDLVLWGSLVFLALMLLTVRGWLGWLFVPALMALIIEIALRARTPLRELATAVWIWFLLIHGVEQLLAAMSTGTYRDDGSDMSVLRRLTLLPGGFWGGVMLVGAVAALGYGAVILLAPSG